MLKILRSRLNKSLLKSLENATTRNKYLLDLLKETLEDSIMTINLIEDVEAIKNKTEEEKKKIRTSIIATKRNEFVDKIIELDNRKIESNSQE